MIYGLIPAGGIGSRMGTEGLPKQYKMIGDKPILVHTAEALARCDEIKKILVLCPREWLSYTEDLIVSFGLSSCVDVFEGGSTRNETIMRGIDRIEERYGLDEDTVLLTHDAVRPFVTQRLLKENIEMTMKYGAADTVIPATDTIVVSLNEQTVEEIPDRKLLFLSQTPQTFKAKKLRELYRSLSEKEKEDLTDAAKIYVLKNEPVFLVRGETFNLKITYPYDMVIAQALFKSGYLKKD